MQGIEISEKEHSVIITVDTDVVERWRIEQALSLLDAEPRDYPHIPSMDPEEQEEIAAHLRSMTPDERRYTVYREG
ncbi:MAG TPA: hypothetical protein VFD13_05585 [Candidatus Kapabacteria bacterium]|nr:hypothetical protein [Candidatus Kapabacteria bacterium]